MTCCNLSCSLCSWFHLYDRLLIYYCKEGKLPKVPIKCKGCLSKLNLKLFFIVCIMKTTATCEC